MEFERDESMKLRESVATLTTERRSAVVTQERLEKEATDARNHLEEVEMSLRAAEQEFAKVQLRIEASEQQRQEAIFELAVLRGTKRHQEQS